MKIDGKVHCFFEQSGTFKNEFIKLGIPAEDYDIQNNFGQTDHTDDLFKAIDDAYDGKPSLFDGIANDDFIMAFYPCIFFCETSQFAKKYCHRNYRLMSDDEKLRRIIERHNLSNEFIVRLTKLCGIAIKRCLRMVVENPWSGTGFLRNNFIKDPDIIDNDRTRRGDNLKKPTAYWFFGCSPTHSESIQQCHDIHHIRELKSGAMAGLCSEERSMLNPNYARNFICDFILGGGQMKVAQQIDMFDELNKGAN